MRPRFHRWRAGGEDAERARGPPPAVRLLLGLPGTWRARAAAGVNSSRARGGGRAARARVAAAVRNRRRRVRAPAGGS
jgi:hypothetical protein